MGKRRKARILALQIVYQHDIDPRPVRAIIESFWESQGAPEEDIRRFAEELAEGMVGHRDEIDSLTRRTSSHWDLDRMAVVDRNILRLAVFELLYRDDIPPKVTVNEFVDIAKKYSTEDSGAFVNGVLDRVFKEHAGKQFPSSS